MAFFVMQASDLVSSFFLPRLSEANNLVVHAPLVMAAIKIAITALLPVVPLGRYRNAVLLIGALVGAFGFGSNVSAILGST